MSTEKISKDFTDRVDNTYDIDVLQAEIGIMERIKNETTADNVRKEMNLKIQYARKRIAILRERP